MGTRRTYKDILKEYDLETLENADLRYCDLQGVSFYEANLKGVNLKGANLEGADLRFADLSHSGFRRNKGWLDVRLAHVSSYPSIFKVADLSMANLDKANLAGAILGTADFTGASLVKANLANADMRFCTLEITNLQEARLTDAILDRAYINRSNFLKTIYDKPHRPLWKKIAKQVVKNPDSLYTDNWHSPDNQAHCLIGWAIALAKDGREIEDKLWGYVAGLQLLGAKAIHLVHRSKAEIIEHLEEYL